VKEIDIEGYKKIVSSGDPHVLVDTREESEWTEGHVKGALHLSKGVVERDIETKVPDKATEVVLYCGGGFRSALVADNLQKMGYTQAISLDGGCSSKVRIGSLCRDRLPLLPSSRRHPSSAAESFPRERAVCKAVRA
jgi:rhodanese-related sulfurtransferase